MSKRPSTPRPAAGRSRKPQSRRTIDTAHDTILEGGKQFQRAHQEGMNALARHDYDGLTKAINRERDLIDEQTRILKRQRTPTKRR